MFQISSRRFRLIGTIRMLARFDATNAASILNEKKKKKLSDLTPLELEADLKENLNRLRKSFDSDERENYVVPVFKKSLLYADQPAIKDSSGEYTYIQLYMSAKRLATQISNICSSASMKNIGYLCGNNVLSPLTQWACWISGQVAMPLNMHNSVEVLKGLLNDSKANALIVTPEYEQLGYELSQAMDIMLMVIDHSFMVSAKTKLLTVPRVLIPTLNTVIVEGTCSNDFYSQANAMLLYTMGITGKPKGVMITHKNLDSQMKSLIRAWKLNSNDCLLHALPMQHPHGYVNACMSPLYVGGRVIMHDHFDTKNVWSSLLGINTPIKERSNIFMAMPAVYNLLIADYEKVLSRNNKMMGYISNYCKENVRLMTSGGAPLPPTIFRRWRDITGHNILECYGTTEFGPALSNPYVENDKETDGKRRAGFVGLPLPDVRVRLVDSKNNVLVDCVGEYTDDNWTVNYLKTKTPKISQEKAYITSAQAYAKAAEFVAKYFHNREENVKPSWKDKLTLSFKKFVENVFYAVTMASNFTKFFQTTNTTSALKEPESAKKADSKARKFELFKRKVSNEVIIEKLEDTDDPTSESSSPCAQDNYFHILDNQIGELQVSGPNVFSTYFENPEETRKSFSKAFFKTGDLATFRNGAFKILGRTNVDVIEIGCKKVSSYDIESLILEHPNVRDVTVIAVPDKSVNKESNRVKKTKTDTDNANANAKSLGVVCVLHQKAQLDLISLNIFCSKSLPKYLLPTKLKIVDELPRSNMIEINREALRQLFEDTEDEPKNKTE